MKRKRKTTNGDPASADDTKLITVGIDRDTHKRLRLLSVERGCTMARLVRIALDEWLARVKS
ncbi:MAG: hypothetical protein ACLQU2_14500 [Candidatus Binataceae bacterium]